MLGWVLFTRLGCAREGEGAGVHGVGGNAPRVLLS